MKNFCLLDLLLYSLIGKIRNFKVLICGLTRQFKMSKNKTNFMLFERRVFRLRRRIKRIQKRLQTSQRCTTRLERRFLRLRKRFRRLTTFSKKIQRIISEYTIIILFKENHFDSFHLLC